ncbi:MAG: carboxylesterase family protein [Roseburia sp.]|nr:carboxylesterase family protein [Roseburia sp.]
MNQTWKIRIIKISLFLFGVIVLNMGSRNINAAEKPAYTLTKGKRVTITTIINKNPLTSPDKNKYKNLTWKSGNKKIIKVVKNKKIKGLKKGSTYLRGYNSKKKKVLAIKVTVGKKVSKIKVNSTKVEMVLGDKTKLNASVSPASASNKKMFYSSSVPTVATVSKTGKVTAVKEGSSVITITSKDGHAKKKIKVKVEANFTIMTSKGAVKGTWEPYSKSQALIWYGVPYGASTAGANRWKAPQPVTPWSGTLSAELPKAQAAQYGDGTSYTGTEDCLYVNVIRPNSAEKNLPVMVYIHGGGNASGTSNVNFGNFVAATNCIVVTVEHRLGAFGYLSHPALRTGTAEENSGNFALLDIKAALTWVRDEIGNFGGNPGNVTLSGFSAGARNALLCMISPGMQGLFQKALIFSGGCNTCTNKEGEESAEDKLASILEKRGTYPDKKSAKEYLDAVSDDVIRNLFNSLTTAEVANMYRSSALRLGNFPQGFNDGVVIPKDGFSVIRSGNYNRVPIILGSDATEFSSFAWSGNLALNVDATSDTISSSQMLNLVANGVKYGSMLQSGHYIEKTANLLNQDMAHAPVYAYRFYWGTDAGVTDGFYSTYVGAFHGASKDFLRKSYKNNYTSYAPNALSEANKQGRQDLTSVMQKYIANFLAAGNPNGESLGEWGTWNSVPGMDKIMSFNADHTKSISAMSSEYYDESDTFNQMRAMLAKADYDILVNSLFKGRFFMPEIVPQY